MEREGRVIEIRNYHTVHGLWRYFTADDGQICLDRYSYLMIGTLEAYEKIRDFFGAGAVIPLYVWVDDGERLFRALERERRQEHPRYAEMCRRYLADEEDFASDRLRQAGIEKTFENSGLESALKELSDYIRENLEERQEA